MPLTPDTSGPLLTLRPMMEGDGKQCRALIGPFQVERFDLLPPHQSGGEPCEEGPFVQPRAVVPQRSEPTVTTCLSGRGVQVSPLL